MHHTPSGGAAGRAVRPPTAADALDVVDRPRLACRDEHAPCRVQRGVADPTSGRRERRHRVGEIDEHVVVDRQGTHAGQLTDGDRETGRIIRARRAHAEDELAARRGHGFGERSAVAGMQGARTGSPFR